MIRKHLNTLLKAAMLLIMVAVTLTVSAQSTDKNITLSSRNQTRQSAIEAIQAQTGYRVVYSDSHFDAKASVNFGRTEMPLSELLDKLTEGTGNSYSIDKDYILLYRDAQATASSHVAIIASRTVSGVVMDVINGAPQEGVTVGMVDNANSAKTTSDGRFRIDGVPAGRHILRLASADGETVRYSQITVSAGSNANITLFMSDDNLIAIAPETTASETLVTEGDKFTAFYRPNTNDHIMRAFNGESKSEFTFIPTGDIQNNYLPKAAVKTNLLFLAAATPNLAVEFGLARKWTLDIAAVYNPIKLQDGGINRYGLIQPELRYWFCQRFEKHFIGAHGLYGRFNIGQVDFLTSTFEQNRYKGWAAGAGISYGYHLPMAKRWAWEFTVGLGYVYLEYDKFRCYECDEFVAKKNRHYFGPTKAGVSLIFMIK